MKARATIAVGALIACGYLSTAVVTARVSGHAVLPLYEGVGNAPAYQWVNPPAPFKTANVVPKPNTTTLKLGASGNGEAGIVSSDTQFIVTLSVGAVPAKSGARSAAVRIAPLDPATLGALPGDARPDGNAYQLLVDYQPSGGAITSFAAKASEVLSVPLPANRGLFYSTDGKRWTRVAPPAPKSETTNIGGSSRNTGYFLAGTTHKPTASSGSSGTSLVTVIIGVLVGVVLVGAAVWFLLRLMRPAPARPKPQGKRPNPSASRRPPPRKR